jgi:hypothetical protein
LAQRHEVGVGALIEPSPPRHELLPEVAEMRNRAAERGEPKLQEGGEHLTRTAFVQGRLDSRPIIH